MFFDSERHRCRRRAVLSGRWAILIVIFAAARVLQAQPLATVPPYGEAPIGYSAFVLNAGPDTLSTEPNDRRRLLVETWFPAMAPGSEPKPWSSDAMGSALADQFPFPKGFHTDIRTHAWLDAPPDTAALPVVLFSHGLSFPAVLYQSFFEDLASRGYAVFAVGHPHGTAIEYPDGTTLDMSRWPRFDDEAQRQRMLAVAADVWAEDLRLVVESIISEDSPAGVGIDSSRIALIGHSLGGTAVGKLSQDKRFSAVIVMEGAVRSTEDEQARGSLQTAVPLLHLIGEYNRLELERPQYLPGPEAPVFTAVVRGTGHAYFSDLIHFYRAFADRAWLERHRYELDPDRVIRIAGDYIAAFLDWRMRGASSHTLLRRPTYAERVEGPLQGGYPEVDLSIAVH